MLRVLHNPDVHHLTVCSTLSIDIVYQRILQQLPSVTALSRVGQAASKQVHLQAPLTGDLHCLQNTRPYLPPLAPSDLNANMAIFPKRIYSPLQSNNLFSSLPRPELPHQIQLSKLEQHRRASKKVRKGPVQTHVPALPPRQRDLQLTIGLLEKREAFVSSAMCT